MSLPNWALPFKEPHTEIKFLNGRYYKYSVTYQYVPERKRTIKITGSLLGKITEKDGFIPSEKNKLRQSASAVPKVDIKTYGVYALFEDLLKDEIPSLRKVFGDDMAEQLVTFAMFRWAYQSPIKRALSYQSHDYCNEVWSAKTSLSDKQITSFLKYVGENRELVVQWMKYLLPETKENGEKFVMMDSTHVMSASENISVNAPGYNPSFDFGRQIRLMYMFSAEFA